jgi:hypothetical protein
MIAMNSACRHFSVIALSVIITVSFASATLLVDVAAQDMKPLALRMITPYRFAQHAHP